MLIIYQLKTSRQEKKAVLNLNSFFYPTQVLEKTAKEFSEICAAKISRKENRTFLELNIKGKYSEEEVALNFINHATALRKEMF